MRKSFAAGGILIAIIALIILSGCASSTDGSSGCGGCGSGGDDGKCVCNKGTCKWEKGQSSGCQGGGCSCQDDSELERKKERECEQRTPGSNNIPANPATKTT